MLGGENVGTVDQQIRRQAHGNFSRKAELYLRKHPGLGSEVRYADQKNQRIAVLISQAQQRSQIGPRLTQKRLGLGCIQLGGRSDFIATPSDAAGILPGGKRLLRNGDLFIEFAGNQVCIGDLSHQAYGYGAARLLGSKIGFKGRLRQAAHPSPEIQFPDANAQRKLILL